MTDTLRIPSVTGVDLEYRIAGPGGRSYAFVIDWHIRTVLALTWFLAGTLLLTGKLIPNDQAELAMESYLFIVFIPANALYFLYHPVLELAMRGRTPGKRMAGVRIVTQTGEVPGVGAILIRNVLRILDQLPAFYAVGLTATIFTEQSVRIGDMAAGTLLIYDEDNKRRNAAFAGNAIGKTGLEQQELIRELLERWQELEPEVRLRLGNRLLERLGLPAETDAALLQAALRRAAHG